MKILFAGTPQLAVPSLEKLSKSFDITAVLTAPDRPKGRGKRVEFSPVKKKAVELGIPVLQPETLKGEAREQIRPLKAELLVVYAYGRIFGPKFLSLFPKRGINVHPSLLPRYRGSTPLIAPIINGDAETGISVQTVELAVDTGDILGQVRIPLAGRETAGDLAEKAAKLGAELLAEIVKKMEEGRHTPLAQGTEGLSCCRRLNKQDGLINWSLPARMIERMIRAYTPWPRAYSYWNGRRITIHRGGLPSEHITVPEASQKQSDTLTNGLPIPGLVRGMDRKEGFLLQTGDGLLAIKELQLEGKTALQWDAFFNGNADFIRARLGPNTAE
jgi:methionyl-tRNA formyltransferase